MKLETINKVQGLFQTTFKRRVKDKTYTFGPYWRGWFMEDGKQKQLYIGKELPKELQYLLDGKVMRPGRKLWSWPAQKAVNNQDTETHTP